MTKQARQIPRNPEPDKKKKRLKNAAYAVLILLLLLLAAGGVFARYVYSKANTGLVTAKEFYFTSDKLSSSGASYTLNPGTTSIEFTLQNHADALRYSDVAVSYTVAVAGDGASVADSSGTLTEGKLSGVNLTLTGLQDGQTYTVTAIGEAGYSETLTATFTVLPAGTGVYKHLDASDPAYVVLTVWTENVCGSASIAFPAGLIPDATDPVLTGVTNYSNGSYAAATVTDATGFDTPYSSRTYRFFKADTSTGYTTTQFTVTVNGTSATPATPK